MRAPRLTPARRAPSPLHVPNSRSIAASTSSVNSCALVHAPCVPRRRSSPRRTAAPTPYARPHGPHALDARERNARCPRAASASTPRASTRIGNRVAQDLIAAPGDDQRDHDAEHRVGPQEAQARQEQRRERQSASRGCRSPCAPRRPAGTRCCNARPRAPLVPDDEHVHDQRQQEERSPSCALAVGVPSFARSARRPSRSSSKQEIERKPTMRERAERLELVVAVRMIFVRRARRDRDGEDRR